MRASRSSSFGETRSPLLVATGLVEQPSGREASWLSRGLGDVSRMWPLVLLTRMVILLALSGPGTLAHFAHGGWTGYALVLFLLAADAPIMMVPRSEFLKRWPLHQRCRLLISCIFVSALLFAELSRDVFILSSLSGENRLFVSLALHAMLGACIAGSQRLLGFAYCAATLAPFIADLSPIVPLAVPFACLVGMLVATFSQARSDQGYFERRQHNVMQGEQARSLLTEFEDAGLGWFWETDRSGDITYVSETLARKLGKPAKDLIGTPMAKLIRRTVEDEEGRRSIGFHMSARTAFSDLAVRADVAGEECWWSLTGRPIITEYGQFLGFRGSGADLTEMRKSQAEVSRLARFDSLTGLANRSQMLATLEQSRVDAMGRESECALFILDLDRFKVVNDTMGHPAGDALLRQVAQRLSRVVGNIGKVGRLGGDEFQVVLPGAVDRAALAKLADTIIHTVSQPYGIDATQVVIGVSVGIALSPCDGEDVDTLIRNADLALYKAKDSGRGAYRFYSQDMHADLQDRRQLEQDLRHAISTGGLHVEYQPVVATTTERISGFETLVRWTHPTRGKISPTVFVAIAEEAGLITQIGEWVLRTACEDAMGWPNDVRVAVNVSPIQFGNPAFPVVVMNALAKTGLSPERLELEITESVFLDDSGNTDAMFARLKGLGVRLALDDFGTGYSALGYLKTAPFDKIKIDQSFVRGAAIKGSRNGAIVKSIVSLAEALSMETTAEGAETLDELELIRTLGCSHIQGYIYGRPITNVSVMARFAAGAIHAVPSGFKASREPRRMMMRSVKLRHGAHDYEGRIRNISGGGALIEGLSDVPPGTVFQLQLSGNQSVTVECRWSSDTRMGVEFADRIEMDLLRPTEDKVALRRDVGDQAALRKTG